MCEADLRFIVLHSAEIVVDMLQTPHSVRCEKQAWHH